MKLRARVAAVAVATGVLVAPLALASPAQAEPGTKSLASILLKDTTEGMPNFDKNGQDFDILTAAVLAVLDADPESPVSLLTDGEVRLTAFIPVDAGFVKTAKALGVEAKTEKGLVNKLVDVFGVDGIEQILLYHVVPGAKINAKAAAASDGAMLTMANDQTVKVNVTRDGIFLKDKNNDVANPKVIVTDINKGNEQIAHAINRVLLPNLHTS
jgi:uncharacterized surface protein with fasciclin (FAS1) repeats